MPRIPKKDYKQILAYLATKNGWSPSGPYYYPEDFLEALLKDYLQIKGALKTLERSSR